MKAFFKSVYMRLLAILIVSYRNSYSLSLPTRSNKLMHCEKWGSVKTTFKLVRVRSSQNSNFNTGKRHGCPRQNFVIKGRRELAKGINHPKTTTITIKRFNICEITIPWLGNTGGTMKAECLRKTLRCWRLQTPPNKLATECRPLLFHFPRLSLWKNAAGKCMYS